MVASLKRTPHVSIVVACVAIALLPVACAGSDKDVASIQELLAKEVAAFNKKDFKAISEIWSQDGEISKFDVLPPGRLQGWPEVGHSIKGLFDRCEEIQISLDKVRVSAGGGIGVATYDWSIIGRMGESALEDRGQATAIYRKASSGWRLVHVHYSVPSAEGATSASDLPGGEAPKEAKPAEADPAAPTPKAPARGRTPR